MFTSLCIIFLTGASFLSVQALPLCPLFLSVDISTGTRLANLSIVYDNIVFPKESQFVYQDTTRACVCDVKPCIRKCCPKGKSVTNYGCASYENAPSMKFHHYTEPMVNSSPDFYTIYNANCSGGRSKVVVMPNDIKFSIHEDGQIYLMGHKSESYPPDEFCYDYFDDYNIPGNHGVLSCLTEKPKKAEEANFLFVGMIISMPFLLLTFIVYALLPERNIHGKCLMSYVFTLFCAYVLLVTIQLNNKLDKEVCRYVGLLCNFFFMVSFFWMNVMSIDIWWTFSGMRRIRGSKKQSERRKFLIYTVYAWGVPLFLVILIASLTLSESIQHNVWYNPGMGEGQCWFKEGIATFVYFYLPMAIIIIANMALFANTAYKIKQIQRDTSMLKKIECKKHSYENDKQRFNLYLKLLLAMGVNWIMEVISWAIKWHVPETPKPVWYLTDIINALYGVFIFFIFAFKRNIWKMLKRRYYNFVGKPHLAKDITQTGYASHTRSSSFNQSISSDCKSFVDDTSIASTDQIDLRPMA